jgi:putative PIN family toxin of toxin-antitoxin system
MIAVVFDCMVFLQAAASDRGPAFACLSLVESNHVTLSLSPAILAEVKDVLSRPKLRAKFPSLTPERVDLFLLKVASIAVVTADAPDAGFPLRDPDDLPYLNLAIATGAAYLVTRDPDLLDLMKDSAFLAQHSHLRIVDPVEFLQKARPKT